MICTYWRLDNSINAFLLVYINGILSIFLFIRANSTLVYNYKCVVKWVLGRNAAKFCGTGVSCDILQNESKSPETLKINQSHSIALIIKFSVTLIEWFWRFISELLT